MLIPVTDNARLKELRVEWMAVMFRFG